MIMTILVCIAGLAPADCQSNTAKQMFPGVEVKNEFECMFAGVQYAASLPAVQELVKDRKYYVKVQCTETNIGIENHG